MLAPDTETLRQPDLYERTGWLCSEMLVLAQKFSDFATKLETARAAQSFSGMRSVAIDIDAYLDTFRDQATQLTGSLNKAIENETQRRVKP